MRRETESLMVPLARKASAWVLASLEEPFVRRKPTR